MTAITEYPLGTLADLGPTWKPTQIRYAKLHFDIVNGDLEFQVVKHKKWQGENLAEGIDYAERDLDDEQQFLRQTPYDLKVNHPCYWILKLSSRNWRWRLYGDGAITTKTNLKNYYGGLTPHTDEIVYFGCKEKAPKSGHSANFHVVFSQAGGKSIPVILDPDIRFPGGVGDD